MVSGILRARKAEISLAYLGVLSFGEMREISDIMDQSHPTAVLTRF